MKLTLGGDSHAQCILAGLRRLAPAGFEIVGRSFGNGAHVYDQFFEIENGWIQFTVPEYRANWSRLTDDLEALRDTSIFLLSLGLSSGPLFREQMWIDYDPPGFDGPGEALTRGVFQAIVEAKTKHIRAFYLALKERGASLMAVPAPPPHRQHWSLKTHDARKVALLHRLFVAEMEAFFATAAIPCVRSPAEAEDETGFLRPEFRVGIPEEDPHHANTDYGELVARAAVAQATRLIGNTASP